MTTLFSAPTASVLVVIPCLNEVEHIEGVVTKLLVEVNRINMKIVIADGGSTDGTRAIIRRLVEQNRAVFFLDNPKRIQSAGVNRAVQNYGHLANSSSALMRIATTRLAIASSYLPPRQRPARIVSSSAWSRTATRASSALQRQRRIRSSATAAPPIATEARGVSSTMDIMHWCR